MPSFNIKNFFQNLEFIPALLYLTKWFFFCLILGVFVGGTSAFFLFSLNEVTNYREAHPWIIWLLPIAGLAIGLLYHYYGGSTVRGNNLLIEELQSPKNVIPFKMAPLVFIGTIITHLFGGSAGREGTAVQMGGAIADQFTSLFKWSESDRKIVLTAGISAGFASIFGTPIAGAVFALEVIIVGRIRFDAILPSVLAAIFAHYFCSLFGAMHTHYHVNNIPELNLQNILYVVLAGIIFGLIAKLFSKLLHYWSRLFKSKINFPPLRPIIGGLIIALAVFLMGTTKYIGLGVPIIVDAFNTPLNSYDFLLKLVFTTFTIGAGFKGGEVTPLFFIGATFGNALIWFIPLPIDLLAGLGFVAVFAGATNTPIACIIMGIELFGIESGIYIAIACSVAYIFSGHSGIYNAQIIGSPKNSGLQHEKGKPLSET